MKHFLSFLSMFCMAISGLFATTYNLTWTQVSGLSLPDEVKVYSTTTTLNGRAFNAWYAMADMSKNNVELRSILSSARKTPSGFVSAYGANAYVCVNGGFFDTSTSTSSSYSLVVDQGSLKASNIASVTRSGLTYYPTRGALGVDSNQTPSIGWSYSLNGSPWLYPAPSANVEGETPQAQPSSSFPVNGSQWDVYSAVGGGPVLVKEGVNLINDYSTNYELLQSDVFGPDVKAPRTAIGYTSSGKMILFVCDGRQTQSQGATLSELADLLIELGCTNALNLDGGGSTAMIADGACVNSPSDGSQRAVASAVMFAKKEEPVAFAQLWNYTETSGNFSAASTTSNPNWTYANTYGRAIAAYGDYVFVPIRSDGTKQTVTSVRVVNANTGQWIQNLSMTGVSGGAHSISCVEASTDGKILVSNLSTNVSSSPFKIYLYDANNLNADPSVLLSFPGNSTTGTSIRMGDTFTYEGSIASGTIRVALNNTSDNTSAAKYYVWNVVDGAVQSVDPTVVYLYNADGSNYTTALGGYPRVYAAGADSVWIKGSGNRPRLFVGNKYVGVVGTALTNNCGNTALPFTYQGKRYLASLDYNSSSYIGEKGVLLDVSSATDGTLVCQTPTVFGTTANGNGTDGVALIKYDRGFKVFFLSASEGVAGYSVGTTDNTTGITASAEEPVASIAYLDPAHSIVYFNVGVQDAALFSIAGQVVSRVSNSREMSVAGLSGLYLLHIVAKDGNLYTQKLLVK